MLCTHTHTPTLTHDTYNTYILVSPVHPMRFRGARACKLPNRRRQAPHLLLYHGRCRILLGKTYALHHQAQATDTIIYHRTRWLGD